MKVCDGKESARRRLKTTPALAASGWPQAGPRRGGGGEGSVCSEDSCARGHLSKGSRDALPATLGHIQQEARIQTQL